MDIFSSELTDEDGPEQSKILSVIATEQQWHLSTILGGLHEGTASIQPCLRPSFFSPCFFFFIYFPLFTWLLTSLEIALRMHNCTNKSATQWAEYATLIVQGGSEKDVVADLPIAVLILTYTAVCITIICIACTVLLSTNRASSGSSKGCNRETDAQCCEYGYH